MDSAHCHSTDIPDDPHSSSISEIDSLSDFDWLDVSSGRESDDNHSVSSTSNADEHDGLPHSRRSSVSTGSSRDGDVEAWEGFVDDSADETGPVDQVVLCVSANQPSTAGVLQATSVRHVGAAGTDSDVVEEQRVKDALDQSMVSTLSASRSSTMSSSVHPSTPHASLRDLRLSFPDPLTSSRDDVHESYEETSPSDATFFASDDEDALAPCQLDSPVPQTEDTGSLPTPVPPRSEYAADPTPSTSYLDIVLYGSSSSSKWDFIDVIMKKIADCAQGDLILSHKITAGYSRSLCVRDMKMCEGSSLVVSVIDRTDSSTRRSNAVRSFFTFLTSYSSTFVQSSAAGRPSLAVLYLPSGGSLPSPADHDYFLSVLVRSPCGTDSLRDTFRAAFRIWEMLEIPESKHLHLNDANDFILELEDLDQIYPPHALRVFRSISATEKKSTRRPANYFTPIHSITMSVIFVHFSSQMLSLKCKCGRLAIFSLILGLVVNSALRTGGNFAVVVAPMPQTSPWTLLRPTENLSAAQNVVTADVTIIPSSFKDFALAVFNPTTPIEPTRAHLSPSTDQHGPRSDRSKSPKDIIALPGASLLSERRQQHSQPKAPPAETSTSALSVRLADSLSVFFDVESAFGAVGSDLREVITALEELLMAINRQTAFLVRRSKGRVGSLGDIFQYRNSRARERAKELKDMAEGVVSYAGEQLKGRACVAREKARDLKDFYLASVERVKLRRRHSKAIKKERQDKEKKQTGRRQKKRPGKRHGN
jgi:hypothetical protein